MGPASRRALLACAKDRLCPAPVTLLRSEVILEASSLELPQSGHDFVRYAHDRPAFSTLYPPDWSVKEWVNKVVFLSAEMTAQCALLWLELDWMSQRLEPTAFALSQHEGWRENVRINSGFIPAIVENSELSVNGFPAVEYIDDLRGGMSIKRYIFAGETLFMLDCEAFSAVFESKLEIFKTVLDSFQPG